MWSWGLRAGIGRLTPSPPTRPHSLGADMLVGALFGAPSSGRCERRRLWSGSPRSWRATGAPQPPSSASSPRVSAHPSRWTPGIPLVRLDAEPPRGLGAGDVLIVSRWRPWYGHAASRLPGLPGGRGAAAATYALRNQQGVLLLGFALRSSLSPHSSPRWRWTAWGWPGASSVCRRSGIYG